MYSIQYVDWGSAVHCPNPAFEQRRLNHRIETARLAHGHHSHQDCEDAKGSGFDILLMMETVPEVVYQILGIMVECIHGVMQDLCH